ncbi:hypothetical protein [Brumimicrobium aurantiacum]|uniref:Uncharacterized protein n=1 Tax=Brumimicrobium aurantiacum TaxID=1737063 RepID=A0A3E1EZV7_9FLAO|nr:hypothetical protein [Brumimicrobium aurantiacum]RFC55085.1 hypothetical protein DXU93_04495 [Brumimicrobium aurantiacum]
MAHRFYLKSDKDQVKTQLHIAFLALFFNAVAFFIAIITGLYFLFFIFLVISLTLIAPFIDVPQLKKSGKFIYYSNLFLAEKEKDGIIKVHGGTLFDYVFTLEKSWSPQKRKSYILQQYLEGLLTLIETFENQDKIKIKGTTYFVNAKTLKRFGFKKVSTDNIQKFILFYNYFNLLVSNSFVHQKLSFPSMRNLATFEGEISEIGKQKELIETLNQKLKKQ